MDNRTIEQIRDNETRLIKELIQKENIINKAIDYIEKEITCYSDLEIDDLIDILQGSE